MRLVSTSFAMAFLSLVAPVALHLTDQGASVSAQFVGDATLARAWGTNGGQQGGSDSYSCDNVNASGSNQVSKTRCTAYTPTSPPPANTTCVECNGDNVTGKSGGMGTLLIFAKLVTCSGQKKVWECTLDYGITKASCFTSNANGETCSGTFNEKGVTR